MNTKAKLAAPFVDKATYYNLTLMFARSHRLVARDLYPDPSSPPSAARSEELTFSHSTTSPSEGNSNSSEEEETRRGLPWIDENLDPFTGAWISRTILRRWGWPAAKGGKERGKDYNHSTFVDLVITGLAGLRPRPSNDLLVVNPLVPPDAM